MQGTPRSTILSPWAGPLADVIAAATISRLVTDDGEKFGPYGYGFWPFATSSCALADQLL